jgi:hypothetical protein
VMKSMTSTNGTLLREIGRGGQKHVRWGEREGNGTDVLKTERVRKKDKKAQNRSQDATPLLNATLAEPSLMSVPLAL